ncbi:hypothetical protein EFY79_14010 [Hanamia caeni]|uniref:Uncharacterized protein n=1 Tax=Hanamia caeni TaxID=2294116 RepID=A0A3M9NAG7_9BACT|nr:hypothetical protein EFY79_14010 [Hanamia caeni]
MLSQLAQASRFVHPNCNNTFKAGLEKPVKSFKLNEEIYNRTSPLNLVEDSSETLAPGDGKPILGLVESLLI